MNVSSVIKNIKEMSGVGVDLILGRYPGFVYGKGLDDGQIPIFVFHSVEPDSFEKMLQFLAENKYTTLTSEDLYRYHVDRNEKLPARSIMLTFGDGMKSIWTFAYPLLKRYGFKATTFLIPGRINNETALSPTLDDVLLGKVKADDIRLESVNGYEALANWSEISAMHDSGVIDFQSHSNGHELIFTSPEIIGFLSPQSLARYHEFEFPRECFTQDMKKRDIPLGRPLYTTAPRLSDELRYIDDLSLMQTCVDYVATQGEGFFDKQGWQAILSKEVAQYQKGHPSVSRFETREEQKEAIYLDLQSSKLDIEKRLYGKTVRSLCFPWGVGSPMSLEIARSLGFVALYWGKVDGKLIYQRSDDPLKTSRIGEDFFYLLPGNDRESLINLVLRKLKRRLQQGSPFYSH